MPGQMLTGLKVLVKETGLSYQSTRTCLEKLKKYKNLTIKSTNKYSIISVINWSIYQQDENQINTKSNKQLTNNQQTTNNKQEYKEEKNIKNTTYNNDFEQFWAAYPKKVGKGAAYNSWKKINPSNGTFALIINAVQKQKRCDQWEKDNGQFIPHPQTWLNQSRWEDEPEESRNAKIKPISKEITSENVDDIYAN
jgi:hypothetical protein